MLDNGNLLEPRKENHNQSSFLKTVFLAFVKQVGFGTTQINNFGTTVPVFLLLRTLFAIIGVRDPHSSADDTTALERAVVAFITNSYKRARPDIGVTNHAFPVTFLT